MRRCKNDKYQVSAKTKICRWTKKSSNDQLWQKEAAQNPHQHYVITQEQCQMVRDNIEIKMYVQQFASIDVT